MSFDLEYQNPTFESVILNVAILLSVDRFPTYDPIKNLELSVLASAIFMYSTVRRSTTPYITISQNSTPTLQEYLRLPKYRVLERHLEVVLSDQPLILHSVFVKNCIYF